MSPIKYEIMTNKKLKLPSNQRVAQTRYINYSAPFVVLVRQLNNVLHRDNKCLLNQLRVQNKTPGLNRLLFQFL